jgi:UDP-2-acetamido-2-deoxy-ribo-hexuluronate aminotransferase
MKVSFSNHSRTLSSFGPLVGNLIEQVACSGGFILKRAVSELEAEASRQFGYSNVIAVSNPADAMTIVLRALGLAAGSQVLYSALAPAHLVFPAVSLGAAPVFVDEGYDQEQSSLDWELALTPQFKAMVVGRIANHGKPPIGLIALARKHSVVVVEETDVASPSLYSRSAPSIQPYVKIASLGPWSSLTGIGDGAIILCDDSELSVRMRMLRNHGQDGITRFKHHVIGYNHRMDDVCAGFSLARLRDLPGIVEGRRRTFEEYSTMLVGLESHVRLLRPQVPFDTPLQLLIEAADRDGLRNFLIRNGVDARGCLDSPLPLHPWFDSARGSIRDYPLARDLCNKLVSLPFYETLTKTEIEYVCGQIRRFYER